MNVEPSGGPGDGSRGSALSPPHRTETRALAVRSGAGRSKARIAREVAPLLFALTDKNAQEASINFVATRLGLSPDGIRSGVVEVSGKPTPRFRDQKEEPDILIPTKVEREIGALCALALQSHEVLDFLCDQTEQLLIGAEGREGEVLLRRILTVRPAVPETAAVNTFLENLSDKIAEIVNGRKNLDLTRAKLEEPTREGARGKFSVPGTACCKQAPPYH